MLCPQCRRMVGKDGYCPLGHLARPELQMPPPKVSPSSGPPPAPPPPPVPAEPPAPAPAEHDPYTPPGLGPSNPPPPQAAATSTQPSASPHAALAAPQGTLTAPASSAPPPVPTEQIPAIGAKKSNKLVAFLVALGLAAVATIGFVTFGGSAGAANLKYVFTAGESQRYQLSMTMKISGGNLTGGGTFDGSIEMVMRQKVRNVDQAGVATIEYSFEKLRMSQAGRSEDIPVSSNVITIEMAPDGRVISTSGTDFLGDINPAAGIFGPESFTPILPRSNVDPGDSWSLDGNAPNPFGEPFHVKGTARYVKREGAGDLETAVIDSEIDSPIEFRIEFAKLGELAGRPLPPGMSKDAAMTFVGNLSADLQQAMATKSGFLRSVIGEMKMTGTFGFEGGPQIGDISGVLNMSLQMTMTALS